MKHKLYESLKAKILEDLMGILLAVVLWGLVASGVIPKVLTDITQFMMPLVVILAVCLTVKALYSFHISMKDYFAYMKKNSCETTTAEVVDIRERRTKYRTYEYPVVRDVTTGKEVVLVLADMKDVKRGRTYTFIYLKHTRIGVMSSVIWEEE